MPAITPLQHDIRGLTGRSVGAVQSRNVSYSSWTTLVEVNINPAEECDLLIIGHISVRQSGQAAREARVTVRVMLDNTQIGEGGGTFGNNASSRPAYQSSGILASARDVSPGQHTIRVQGIAWSTTGAPTVRADVLSIGIVEFYR